MPVFSFIVGLIEMLMEVAMIEIRETLPSGNGNGTEGEKEEKKNPLQGWEGQDIPSATDGSNLARLSPHLTPTLRRILPVLRIAFKWLERKPHTPYLGQSLDGRPPTPLDALASNSSHLDAILVRVAAVHATHASFANLLLETFPPTELKRLTMPLEEDVELKGFQPLRRKKTHAGERVQGNEEEGKDDHPNEVELMRIWSLVNDAWGMTKIEVRLSSDSHLRACRGNKLIRHFRSTEVWDQLRERPFRCSQLASFRYFFFRPCRIQRLVNQNRFRAGPSK
jgi:hypothetical protein